MVTRGYRVRFLEKGYANHEVATVIETASPWVNKN